jgi:hypothetical protein
MPRDGGDRTGILSRQNVHPFWRQLMFSRLSFLTKSVVAAGAVALSLVAGALPASAGYLRVGLLTCNVAGGVGLIVGSSKPMNCTYKPDDADPAYYSGRINKVGLDIGVTGESVIVWAVLAAERGMPQGALAGTYVGASAEATVVVGAGANVLVGGSNRSVALQPLSVTGQLGLNFAVAISSLDLWAQ